MTLRHSELVLGLEKLIDFLIKYGETNWASEFKNLKRQLELDYTEAIILLTQSRGGMGGFSDLVICQMNGHIVAKENEADVNNTLMQLADYVFTTAKEIRIAK